MVFCSAAVAGPRPSNASEDSVFTSADSRSVLKVGVSAACTTEHAAMIRVESSSRFTGGHLRKKETVDTSKQRCAGPFGGDTVAGRTSPPVRRTAGRLCHPAASVLADHLAAARIDAQLDLVA